MVYKPTNITGGPPVVYDFNHFMSSFRMSRSSKSPDDAQKMCLVRPMTRVT